MTAYYWNVSNGNFGAATSWNPQGAPTSSDQTFINVTTSLYGSGSAQYLNIYGAITVTVSAALTTNIANDVLIGSSVSGSPTIVDVDATWTNNCYISIGQDGFGNGVLNVNSGGSLITTGLYIGDNFNNQTPSYTGAVTVQGGGSVKTTGGWDEVGVWQGGAGALTVTGTGSSFTSGGVLNIGDNGTGTLYVENGATLNAVQLNTGVSYDQPTVASGSGTTYIESGAVVTTTGAYQLIGQGATQLSSYPTQGPTGAVTVTGAGSEWNAVNGQIGIGDAGSKTGSLTISNGGKVVATNGFYIGSEWNGADRSYGTLTIESGGSAVSGGSWNLLGSINAGAPASSAVVTGAGSSWTADELIVSGTSTLQATSGGLIHFNTALGMQGGTVQVDSNSTLEDGDAGGAALGYLTVDPDPNYDANFWGEGTIEANVIDNGVIYSNAYRGQGTLVIEGPTGVAGTGTITGSGYLLVGTQSPLDLAVASVASSVHVNFAGWDGTLEIESTGFAAPIGNFNAGDVIDIQGLTYSSGASSYTFTPSGVHGGGTLVIHEGASSVSLNIAYSPQAISGNLTLSATATGTAVSFTNGAAQAPFNLWSSLGPFFTTASGAVNGMDYGHSAATDGGTPIWIETATPASSYVAGAANNFTIVLATQDWLGDIQPQITIATDSNFVDPFVADGTFGNLGAATIFSNTSTTGYGGLVYWSASTTAGDYALNFEPFTVSYPTSQPSSNLVTITGSPVTMISAIANPTSLTASNQTPTSLVLAYTTAGAGGTESLYMEGFTNTGVATNSGPALITSGLVAGTPYYIGFYNGSYGYRYLEVGGPLGTGLVGGTFNTTTGALGSPSLYLNLSSYTAFDGISAYLLSSGDTLRLVEGVENGQAVIQSFLNGDSTAVTTFHLSSASDYFEATKVYDPNTAALDWTALAYTDAGKVHLELLNESGGQIGADLIIPGISSFLRLHTMQGKSAEASTRIEIDYATPNPNGGQQIQGFIYDAAGWPYQNTLSGGGLYDGSPFDDTFSWGAGVYTIDGGGGWDTFSATNLSSSQVTLKIDAAGETVLSDGAGDVDTLRRFTTIELSDATVTIAGNTLTEAMSNGSRVVSTFNIAGQSYATSVDSYSASGELLSTKEYNSTGTLTGLFYTSQIPDNFTGDGRSDVLFQSTATPSALATWQLNDTAITGGGSLAKPGPAWTYEGDGDFYGDGHSDILWRNQNGQLAIWKMNGTLIKGSAMLASPGGTWRVVGEGDFYGNGRSDILFQDAKGNLAIWEMNGAAIVGGGNVGNPGANYRLVGIGDFNGDGRSDLLFESASGEYAVWNLNGNAISGGATLGAPGAGWVYKGVGNFNGLGDSDILFENANTGLYASWDIASDKISGGGNIGNPGAVWALAAIGDYSTTGRSSLMFKNTSTGLLASWDLNNTSIVGGGNVGNPGASYEVVQAPPAIKQQPAPTLTFINATSGQIAEWDVNNITITGSGGLGVASGYTALAVGDFNGDGQSDVLFSKAGAYAIWETNGKALTGGGNVGSPGSAYAYKGVGDFNGDGKSDILFEETNGVYATWDLSGAKIVGGGTLGNPGAGLTYVGSGDVTGDSTSDLLLKDASGNYWVSFVSDNKIVGTSEIGNPGAGYALAAIGDLNGDGKADLLFSKGGALASWDLNGASIVGGGNIGSPGAAWTVSGIADLGNTSHASILFDNSSTGQVASWLMNDTSIIGGGTIGAAAGYDLLGVR